MLSIYTLKHKDKLAFFEQFVLIIHSLMFIK